jgi:hypothetical protein
MKRIMFLLVTLTPLFFCSCSSDNVEGALDNTVGSMNLKINGVSHSASTAWFYTKDSSTYITTASGISWEKMAVKGISANTIVIKVYGTVSAGTYVLGLGKDVTAALANISEATSILSKNCLLYYPSANTDEAFCSIYGILTISSASSTTLKGSLSGAGITYGSIGNLSSLLTSGLESFSGSFTAKNYLK